MSLDDEDKSTIREMIESAVKSLTGSKGPDDGDPESKKPAGATPGRAAKKAENDAIAEQVRQAVKDVAAEEKRTAEEAAKEARLAELEEKEKREERAPVQMRRITKALWHRDEDDEKGAR